MKLIQQKTPKPLENSYSVKFKEFVFKLLEKQKSKRPFVVELIDMFPQFFSLSSTIDLTNYNILK